MTFENSAFVAAYCREVPAPLKALYEDHELIESTPVRFDFPDKLLVLEIQYFQPITELFKRDVEKCCFVFAVNSDGVDLIVDLSDPDLPLIQREIGFYDHLGITLADLLKAPRHPL